MKLRRVFGFVPVPVFYKELPVGVGGRARGPLIEIRPYYANDEGIHQHELEHVRQFWIVGIAAAVGFWFINPVAVGLGVIIHGTLYSLVWPYRQWAEVFAYRKQMRYPDRNGALMSLIGAAARLTNPRYRLNLTLDEAKRLLRN